MSYSIEKYLLNAVINGQYDAAETFLKANANPNFVLEDGISSFHLAVGVQNDKMFTKLFLDYGADVNIRSVDDWTPLHVCACYNKIDSLKLLLEYGADPKAVNNESQTPFQLAIQNNNRECAKVLREFIKHTERHQHEKQDETNLNQNSFNASLMDKNQSLNNESIVRSSTLNNTTNWINNNSTLNTASSQEPTVIENKTTSKLTARNNLNDERQSILNSNSNKENRKQTSKTNSSRRTELVNINDLERVISNLIDLKLQEKCLINSNQQTVSPTTASLLKVATSKEQIVLPPSGASTPTSSGNSNISNNQSQKSRFHSPEASRRIPSTLINKETSQSSDKMPILTSPTETKVTSCLNNTSKPSVMNLKNSDKYPIESPPGTDKSSIAQSANVYSKLKSWLKIGNKADEPGQIAFCHKSKGLAGLCLGSSLPQVNSDFGLDRDIQPNVQQQQQQNENNDDDSSDTIIAVNSPKYTSPKKSLFSEISKELANIEKNSNLAYLKNPSNNTNNKFSINKQQNQNEIVYQLDDDNIYFKETTLLTSDNSTITNKSIYDDENYYTANASSVVYSWDAYDTEKIEQIKDKILNKTITINVDEVSNEIKKLTNGELRKRIEAFGDRPGPITATTRKIYELRLMQLEKNGPAVEKLHNEFDEKTKGFSIELIDALNNKKTDFSDKIETLMANCFQTNNCNWREGHLKASFNYLLIDPRVSENLPARAKYLDSQEIFRIFIASIFYIGKGTRSRPYAHLYDALKSWKAETEQIVNVKKPKEQSRKIKQIINIWKDNCGVVSLHCFQNVIPCEAYTREAAMIEAIGMQHLTNLKKGDFYGVANSWPLERKRKLGVLLLKKACDIFIAEGERQIKPIDI